MLTKRLPSDCFGFSEHCSSRGSNGFSLIEMMIVVAILAIVAAIAAPAFEAWIANTRTRSMAEAIQNGLRLAQGEAVKRGVQVQFVLTNSAPITKNVAASSTGQNWVIQTMQRANPATTDEFVQGASLANVGNNSTVVASAATVTFNSFGRVENPVGGVSYDLSTTNGDRPLRVEVSNSGAVRMCDPEFNGTGNPLGCTP